MHQPQITNNSFLHTPPGSKSSPVTLFFISGNPGLIGYYHTFLSLLSSNLASGTRTGSAFQIYARSLAGFDVGDEYTDDSLYSLEDQIQFVQRNLDELIRNSSSCPGPGPGPQKVILIGHSVGSYIAMEVLRRRREEKQARSGSPVELDIIGGVMLFPTVIDIAKSPSGRKLSVLPSLPTPDRWTRVIGNADGILVSPIAYPAARSNS